MIETARMRLMPATVALARAELMPYSVMPALASIQLDFQPTDKFRVTVMRPVGVDSNSPAPAVM
jgi:hypothetical protein